DAFRGRVVVPVRDGQARIEGFIGRDVTGDPRAAKYRNPTLTATFDKSRFLYRPTRHRLANDGHAIVVEGVMDALAMTAAAAERGQLNAYAPVTTSGLAVSRVQAMKVSAISRNPVVLALDGDDAGATGTARWADMLVTQLGGQAESVRFLAGLDPAEWLSLHGLAGIDAFRERVPVPQVDRSIAMEVAR
ncbi:MAG: primase, partial [Gaiellaceae bacterium]|nr:primase [Gaiellaceae bacterium]